MVEKMSKKDEKAQIDKDYTPVRGIFHFYENRGGTLEFPFKKYKDIPTTMYKLTDGEVCTVPLVIAHHLNKNCFTVEHTHCQDENGKPSTKIGRRKQRCGFQSLEFLPEEDLREAGSSIYTVEHQL